MESRSSVQEVLRSIGKMYPSFKKNFLFDSNTDKERIPSLLVVINDTLAHSEDLVKEDDFVEIFPMVGGG